MRCEKAAEKRRWGREGMLASPAPPPCSHNRARLIDSLSRGSSPAGGLHWPGRLAPLALLTGLFLCGVSSWMPICVSISDWPRWALSPVLLRGACYVILAGAAALDRGLSVQGLASGARTMGGEERESGQGRGERMKRTRSGFLLPARSLDGGEQRRVFTHGPVIC